MAEKVMNPIFAEAMAKKKKLEEEAESKKNSSGWNTEDYEEISYCALEDQKEVVFRIVGDPFDPVTLKTKTVYDPRLVLQSQIVKDDKKGYSKINWPAVVKDGKTIPDPEWILTRLYNKVQEGKWEKYADGHTNDKGKNGEWKKFHKDTEIFKRIEGNAKEGEKYPKSFYPSTRVVLQGIDRNDSWCKENKHYKVLTAKRSPFNITKDDGSKDTIYFTDTGIPKGLYDKLFERGCKTVGDWDIDFVIVKKSADKDYDVWEGTDLRVKTQDITEEAFKKVVETELSEEEKSYGKHDLGKINKPASYNKLKKNHIALFKLCDLDLGTSFTEELDRLAQIEMEEWNAKKESESKSETTVEIKTEVEVVPEVKEEPKKERRSSENKVNESVESLCSKHFPKWNEIPESDKKTFISIIDRFEGSVPIYKTGVDDLLCDNEGCCWPNTNSETTFPETITVCPICGHKY